MAANTVTFYAILMAVVLLSLGSIVIGSRRDMRMRLVAVTLTILGVVLAAFAFEQLPGKPDGITTEAFRKNYRCATVRLYPVFEKSRGIFMVVRKEDADEDEYLFIEWNAKLAAALQKSTEMAKLNGSKGTIVYGGKSCEEEGDGEEGTVKGKRKGKGKGKGKGGGKGKGKAAQVQRPGSSGLEQEGREEFNFYPDPVPPMPEKTEESSDRPVVIPDLDRR